MWVDMTDTFVEEHSNGLTSSVVQCEETFMLDPSRRVVNQYHLRNRQLCHAGGLYGAGAAAAEIVETAQTELA